MILESNTDCWNGFKTFFKPDWWKESKVLKGKQTRAEVYVLHSVVSINVPLTVPIWEDWLMLLL